MDFCKYIKDFTRDDVQDFFESMPGIRCRVESVEPAYIRGHKVLKVESELGTSYFTDFGVVYSQLLNKARSFTISNEYLSKANNPISFREPVGVNGTDMFAYSWTSFLKNRLLDYDYNTGKRYELDLRLNCRDNVLSVTGGDKLKLYKKLRLTKSPSLVKFIKSLEIYPLNALVGV